MNDIESQVCANILARQTKGIIKYGTTVADNPLPLAEWLQHSYEETLDNAVYLKRAIVEAELMQREIHKLRDIGLLMQSRIVDQENASPGFLKYIEGQLKETK